MKNNSNLPFKKGISALEVIINILKINPKIDSLFFEIYRPCRNLKEEKPNQTPTTNRLLHHVRSNPIEVRPKEMAEVLLRLLTCLDKKSVIGINSKVKLRDRKETFHIPLVDFDCEVSSGNLRKIKSFLRKAEQKRGVILLSGRSYHYYGVELLTEREWLIFLGKCLLSSYIDLRYIGHQLIYGHATLRLTAGGKRSQVPKVISAL